MVWWPGSKSARSGKGKAGGLNWAGRNTFFAVALTCFSGSNAEMSIIPGLLTVNVGQLNPFKSGKHNVV